jgi:hypothetical protein
MWHLWAISAEVALFSLHESWDELKRYTNLRPEKMQDIKPPAPESSLPSVSNATVRVAPATIHSEQVLPVTTIPGSTDRKRAASQHLKGLVHLTRRSVSQRASSAISCGS